MISSNCTHGHIKMHGSRKKRQSIHLESNRYMNKPWTHKIHHGLEKSYHPYNIFYTFSWKHLKWHFFEIFKLPIYGFCHFKIIFCHFIYKFGSLKNIKVFFWSLHLIPIHFHFTQCACTHLHTPHINPCLAQIQLEIFIFFSFLGRNFVINTKN